MASLMMIRLSMLRLLLLRQLMASWIWDITHSRPARLFLHILICMYGDLVRTGLTTPLAARLSTARRVFSPSAQVVSMVSHSGTVPCLQMGAAPVQGMSGILQPVLLYLVSRS